MLRPGRANANTAADQIAVLDAALAQLPEPRGPGAGARRHRGGVQPLLWHITDLGLAYWSGSTAANPCRTPWRRCRGRPGGAAVDPDGGPRDGAQVAELTRWMPATLHRLAARDADHRPPRTPPPRRPAAHHRRRRLAHHRVRHQHRRGRIADLEVRHRLRARAEDRIRGLKDTGLTNLPFQASPRTRSGSN